MAVRTTRAQSPRMPAAKPWCPPSGTSLGSPPSEATDLTPTAGWSGSNSSPVRPAGPASMPASSSGRWRTWNCSGDTGWDRSGPAAPRSWDAVNQAVLRLEQAGVVRQVTIGRRNQACEVVGLFEAMTAYERILASPAADTAVAAPVRPVPERPPRPTSGRNKSGPGADGTPIFEAKAHLRAFPSGSCDM